MSLADEIAAIIRSAPSPIRFDLNGLVDVANRVEALEADAAKMRERLAMATRFQVGRWEISGTGTAPNYDPDTIAEWYVCNHSYDIEKGRGVWRYLDEGGEVVVDRATHVPTLDRAFEVAALDAARGGTR